MSVVDSSSRICRAELCELDGLHLTHDLTPFHVHCGLCGARAGVLCNASFERSCEHLMCGEYHHARILTVRAIDKKPCKRMRDPWNIPSGEALDESILRAAADHQPKLVTQILDIVQNDYGKISATRTRRFASCEDVSSGFVTQVRSFESTSDGSSTHTSRPRRGSRVTSTRFVR